MKKKNMRFNLAVATVAIGALAMVGCQNKQSKGTFGYDLEFLQQHQQTVVLKTDNEASQIIVLPELQGRVITSTANGSAGKSYGWMNYDLIESGEFVEHYNPFGGEDRFWIGPEGGQYSVFFKGGSDFDAEDWYTPPELDTESFEILEQHSASVSFKKGVSLKNYSGFEFDVEVQRTVSIFEKSDIESNLNIHISEGVGFVGYQSDNVLKNVGANAWKKETGLLSIWVLGMFISTDETSAILPYKNKLELNTEYFGEVQKDRLTTTDEAVFFKADGQFRCKIGLRPQNIVPVCGSYDAENGVLTIVQYSFDETAEDYVNSMWRLQEHPYGGDVVNSYNDGPMEDGTLMGPFYELESSSAARELAPNESVKHVHKTYHFEGSFDALNQISNQVLGVDLTSIYFEEAVSPTASQSELLVPQQANAFVNIYQPKGDHFFGPDTENLKAGAWYDEWVPNDHCFVKAEDGKWHIFGITHPLVETDPLKDGIHEGEYASFHAVSTVDQFNESMEEDHYVDHPKILPPKERPSEIPQNHAPYVVMKDGKYHMVYGHSPIRLAVSDNLYDWEPKGELFSEADGARDPSLIFIGNKYHMVFCGDKCVRMRTSDDLLNWSEAKTILDCEDFDPESPSLVFHNGTFYLFVCSWDGFWDQKDIQGAYQHKTYVYQSDDPKHFGRGNEKEITTLNAHAPEIFQDEDDNWYLSSVEWPHRGVSVDKLEWIGK